MNILRSAALLSAMTLTACASGGAGSGEEVAGVTQADLTNATQILDSESLQPLGQGQAPARADMEGVLMIEDKSTQTGVVGRLSLQTNFETGVLSGTAQRFREATPGAADNTVLGAELSGSGTVSGRTVVTQTGGQGLQATVSGSVTGTGLIRSATLHNTDLTGGYVKDDAGKISAVGLGQGTADITSTEADRTGVAVDVFMFATQD